ncbi:MAG: FAD-binding protein [Mycobacteriaceae bacterium]
MSTEVPDLVVAGAGGGLVAALRAAELGLDVLVVEASEHFTRGNNTAMSTAMLPGAGTRWQTEAGISDDAAVFVEDMVTKTHDEVDRALAQALAEVSAELVTWLADHVGVPLDLVTDFQYPGHSRLRCHTLPGRSGTHLLSALLEAVAAEERITMLVPARLTDVTCSDGTVTVEVRTPDGASERIDTRAVLLATNGYGADPDLVRQHVPEIADATYYGSPESTGDALRIGARLGAATGYLDAYQGHAALCGAAGTLVGWATVMHGGYLVDASGARFADETVGYSEFAHLTLARASGGRAVIVLDQRVHDACLVFDDFQDTVASGALRWADTVPELAHKLGVDPAGLAATVEAAAAAAAGDIADPLGRTDWEAPLQPPYAGVHVEPALFHTQGGLRVDGHARVLDGCGAPIAGVYASGGAAMGISGHGAGGYLAGNGLLPALGLAYLAAGDAAASR